MKRTLKRELKGTEIAEGEVESGGSIKVFCFLADLWSSRKSKVFDASETGYFY
jgi:hypothetical protein